MSYTPEGKAWLESQGQKIVTVKILKTETKTFGVPAPTKKKA
jgi:hypothetical protein